MPFIYPLRRLTRSRLNLNIEQKNRTKEYDSGRGKKRSHSEADEQKVSLFFFPPFLPRTQVARYVWNKAGFDAVDPETTDYLMGESSLP